MYNMVRDKYKSKNFKNLKNLSKNTQAQEYLYFKAELINYNVLLSYEFVMVLTTPAHTEQHYQPSGVI